MEFSYNKVELIGTATAEPEMQAGAARLKIETTTRQFVNGNWEENKETFTCFAYGKIAERLSYVHTESRLFIEGELRNKSYVSNGIQINTVIVYIKNIGFLGSAKKPQQQNK